MWDGLGRAAAPLAPTSDPPVEHGAIEQGARRRRTGWAARSMAGMRPQRTDARSLALFTILCRTPLSLINLYVGAGYCSKAQRVDTTLSRLAAPT